MKFDNMKTLAMDDIAALEEAEKSYGDSWKRRGGIGAFMMLARKFDRIENQSQKAGYDIFEGLKQNPGKDGMLDDINDLIRYLMLVREEYLHLHLELDEGEPGPGYVNQD